MHTFKTLTIGITATVLLALAPASRAQTPDELQMMQTFLAIMTDYFSIIESTYEVSSNAEKAAIMQMQKIQEVYEDRGQKVDAVEILQDVLSKTRNRTIRNAAYLMIGDTLKEAGRTDEAIKMLREALSENIEAAQ